MVLFFHKYRWLRHIVLAFNLIALEVCGCCGARAANAGKFRMIDISLKDVKVGQKKDMANWEMCLNLIFTNQTDDAFCFLSSDMAVDYCLEYAEGSSDFESWGSMTVSTSPLKMCDFDACAIRLLPRKSCSFSICQVVVSRPQIGTGLLKLSLNFYPMIIADSSPVGQIFHGELHLETMVKIIFRQDISEYIITPQ